jgi:outer membrane lipoprotein-sorting protein
MLFLLLLALAAAAACGGDGGGSDSGGGRGADQYGAAEKDAGNDAEGEPERDGGGFSDLFVSNAPEALSKSVETFTNDVQSLEGSMKINVAVAGEQVSATGEFAFRAPDAMYMTMSMEMGELDLGSFGQFEILLLGDEVYMNNALFGGWVVMSLSDLGVDGESLAGLREGRSPISYEELVEAMGPSAEIEVVGEEEVEGRTYTHVRVTTDFASMAEALGEALSNFDSVPLEEISGPLTIDLWIDSESLLPYKLVVSGDLQVPDPAGGAGETMSIDLEMEIEEYNGDVDIPEAPADAKPLDEAFGDMFEGSGFEEGFEEGAFGNE